MSAAAGVFVRIRPKLDDRHIDALEQLAVAIATAATDVANACREYRAAFAELEADPGADVDVRHIERGGSR